MFLGKTQSLMKVILKKFGDKIIDKPGRYTFFPHPPAKDILNIAANVYYAFKEYLNFTADVTFLILLHPQKLCYDSLFELKNRDRAILLLTFTVIANHVTINSDPGIVVS